MSKTAVPGLTISTHTLTWSVTLATPEYKSAFAISTHTLTWSVTERDWDENVLKGISTHTLTWSVTSGVETTHKASRYFNSHAHVERDC